MSNVRYIPYLFFITKNYRHVPEGIVPTGNCKLIIRFIN